MASEIKVSINAKGFIQGKEELKKDLQDVANKAKEAGASITGALNINVSNNLKGSIDQVTGAFIPFQEQLTYTDKQLKAHENIVKNSTEAQKGYTDQITGEFVPAQEEADNSSKRLTSSLGAVALAFAGLAVARKVIGFLSDAVDESVKLENALIGVKTVAKSFGQDVSTVEQAVKDFAKDGLVDATQAAAAFKQVLSTGTDIPTAIKLLNSLKDSAAFNRQAFYSVGEAIVATTEGIKNGNSVRADAVGVTKNLSVLEKEYANSLGRTVGSLTDQEKIQARVNGFIREGAIFTGDAAKLNDTYSGSISKLGVAYSQLLASIGSSITSSKIIRGLLGQLTDDFTSLTQVINGVDDKEQLKRLRERLSQLAREGQTSGPLYESLTRQLQNLSDVSKEIGNVTDQGNAGFRAGQAAYLKELSTGVEAVSTEIITKRKELSEKLKYAGLSDLEEAKKERIDRLELAGQDSELKLLIEKDYQDKVQKIRDRAAKTEKAKLKTSAQEIRAEIKNEFSVREQIAESFKNPLSLFGGTKLTQTLAKKIELEKDPSLKAAFQKQLDDALANVKFGSALGFIGTVLQGGAGAKSLLGQAATAFGNSLGNLKDGAGKVLVGVFEKISPALGKLFTNALSFLPAGIGDALGPIVELLAQGPDEVRKQVKEFAKALPELMKNVVLAIPALIDEIAQQTGPIIEALAASMPEVARSLAAQAPMIAIATAKATAFEMPKALLKEAPNMAKAFSVALVQGAGDFLKAITKKATGGASGVLSAGGSGSFFKDIGAAAKGEVLGSIIGGPLGAIGGALGGFFGKFKFATGGEVKSVSGGTPFKDSVPALLQRGEVVLDRNASKKFEQKMDNGNDNAMTVALLANIVNLLKMPQTQPIKVMIGQRELASALYTLDRNGERLR